MTTTDRPTSWFHEEDDGSGIQGFMCLTDFCCETGAATGGNLVHPSIDDLKLSRRCTDECGIVEVRIVGVRIVRPSEEPGSD